MSCRITRWCYVASEQNSWKYFLELGIRAKRTWHWWLALISDCMIANYHKIWKHFFPRMIRFLIIVHCFQKYLIQEVLSRSSRFVFVFNIFFIYSETRKPNLVKIFPRNRISSIIKILSITFCLTITYILECKFEKQKIVILIVIES